MKTHLKSSQHIKAKLNSTDKLHLTKKLNGNLKFNVPKIEIPVKNKGNKHLTENKAANETMIIEDQSRKRQSIVEFNDNETTKVRKKSKYNPSEIMSKLEEFSDVWNDCPDVQNPKRNPNNWFGSADGNVEKSKVETKKYNDESFQNEKSHSESVNKNNSLNKSNYNEHLKSFESRKQHESGKFSAKNNNEKHAYQEKYTKQSKTNTSSEDHPPTSARYDPNTADLKRKKAVEGQRQLQVDQKNIIKQALSSLDGKQKVNKKIVFNDASEPDKHAQRSHAVAPGGSQPTARPKLFDDDDSDAEVNLQLNHQFEGKKGQKLLELQSKFASDSRFALDTRFYESGSEESDNEKPENVDHSDEKQKQLAILESIVQRQIRPLSEIKKKSTIGLEESLLRFDPSREDHSKYIVKPQEPKTDEEKTTGKKKTKKTKQDKNHAGSNVQENKTEVSREQFFTVKDDLKEVLNKESTTEFSLLRLFDSEGGKDRTQEQGQSESVKKLKHVVRNPFKYDSSASEADDDEQEEEEKETQLKQKPARGAIKSAVKPAATSWKTTFFFVESDPRLQEGLEFLKMPEEAKDDEEYAEKRKMLKNFIRHKFKNNNRKKGPFRKKLGGLKTKKFHKKKGK